MGTTIDRRRRFLLSTATLLGALSAYGARAYAQQVCTAAPATNITCDGASTDTQDLTLRPDATITTGANFSVVTGGNAITVSGDGALSYTDENASPLTAGNAAGAAYAIQMTATGDIAGGNAGSITIDTNGVLSGRAGVVAVNDGTGSIDLTFRDNVTGTGGLGSREEGVFARNQNAASTGDVTVTTVAGAVISGEGRGIAAYNAGAGAARVMVNDDVTAIERDGISARTLSGDVVVTTASGTTVSAGSSFGSHGISAGTLTGDIIVTTGSGSTVSGGSSGGYGIRAGSNTAGSVTVTANGDVTGLAAISGGGISAVGGGDTTVTTASGTTVSGALGITAASAGGAVSVTANGDVTGNTTFGIFASGAGTDLEVTTAAGSTVSGAGLGIFALNGGSGSMTISIGGDVSTPAGGSPAIRAVSSSGTDLTVTTAAGTTVTGGNYGIEATNNGSGALSVTAEGDVTGAFRGITVGNSGTDLSVTTGAGSTVGGSLYGIFATSDGSGSVDITADGDVTGSRAILVDAAGTDLNITTGANTTVGGGTAGIDATHSGSGDANVTIGGEVAGGSAGATIITGGRDATVITSAGSSVRGGSGLSVSKSGNGDVTIDTEGAVRGVDGDGIRVSHSGGGPIGIAVHEDSTVTSAGGGAGDFAIDSSGGPTTLIVEGTLNGGAGGAVRFDDLDDRLELHTTGVVDGTVFAGPGTDTLAFAGAGTSAFDLDDIDNGAETRQYRGFDDFRVESGSWAFSGATAAAFDVTGGTVSGNATFGGLNVTGGTLAPGGSIGAMTVNGPFSLGPDAIYEVEADADGNSDTVFVNGTVNLTGATLQVIAADGAYKPETDYTIIDNDGDDAVEGEFGTVTDNLVFLDPSVDYEGGDGNDVVLTLTRAALFESVAQTKNQRAVAVALDRIPTDDPFFFLLLNQTAAGARQAFDALSGEIHASVSGTLVDDSRYAREAVLGRLMQANHGDALGAGGPETALVYNGKSLQPIEPQGAPLAVWISGFGAWGDYDSDGNAASVDRDLGGFISGIDAQLSGTWRAGLATGASFSSVDARARNSAADVETYHLGGYVGGVAGGFALRGGGLYAWNDIDTSRAVIFPGFFERQNASYDADTGQVFGEIAYPMDAGNVALEPFFGLAYVSVDTDSFRERGGAVSSLRGTADQDVGFTTLGLRAATTLQWGGTQVTPHVSAAWQHAFDDVTPGASLAFATSGVGFGVDGVPLAEDSALIDAGFDFAVGANATAGISYSGQFGDGVTDNAVKGRVTWLW